MGPPPAAPRPHLQIRRAQTSGWQGRGSGRGSVLGGPGGVGGGFGVRMRCVAVDPLCVKCWCAGACGCGWMDGQCGSGWMEGAAVDGLIMWTWMCGVA
eukprot:365801-Chlamydomonas_euryale.AAC.10